MHWALDTNLAMSQAVRRLVSGCVELANGRLWLPERALVLMTTRYAKLARTRATRITEHGEGADPFGPDADALGDLVVERSVALTRAFARWAVEETRRNDGLWSLARTTPDTERTAQRMFVAGIARAGEDGTAEEDAHVAAEALEAGCRWIGSKNLNMLQGEPFTKWVVGEQAKGRLLHARTPFIVPPDQAIHMLLDESPLAEADDHRVAAVAWELSRPNDPVAAADVGARATRLLRFANALEGGGLAFTAARIRQSVRQSRNDGDALAALLDGYDLAGRFERTRDAEDRQVGAERDAVARTGPEQAPHGAR